MKTYLGTEIEPVHTGLPKITKSLCPECRRILGAEVFEENGKVIMKKTCPDHGDFKDIVFSDVDFYLRMEEMFPGDGMGIENPFIAKAKTCPRDCGLCNLHTSHTALANIDLTNRCNLKCPICFANANASGYLYEPDYWQVSNMMWSFREMLPVPAACVQFSGGEPTLHPRFLDIVQLAKEMGFSAIQIATNGIKFADIDFAFQSREAGVHSLYLQFDATCDDIYEKIRGCSLLEIKLAVIENCRETGIKVVLVPTVAKGINDNEVGNILKLAIENVDVVSGVSFQPVVFTGRFSKEEREKMRFTLSDLAHCLEEQVGFVKAKDWVPLTCSSSISRMFGLIEKKEITAYTCHPHCSAATYLFVDEKGKATQFTDFVDFKALTTDLNAFVRNGASKMKIISQLQFLNLLRRRFNSKQAPEGLTLFKFIRTLRELTGSKYERDESKVGRKTYRTLMVGGMHFMDAYNYDIQRVQRCVVHYAAPNGRIYPFCAYNSGPCYRERIEREFAVIVKSAEV